jgi:5-methylcytosine-specific restriction endonuclease McrA
MLLGDLLKLLIVSKESYIRKDFMSYSCNRKNVIWRDKYTCQYCAKRFSYVELTMDHIIPKSRGGDKSWSNIVASCKKCNSNKGNRTPEEAKMPLIKKPTVPRWSIHVLLRDKKIPQEWKDFI